MQIGVRNPGGTLSLHAKSGPRGSLSLHWTKILYDKNGNNIHTNILIFFVVFCCAWSLIKFCLSLLSMILVQRLSKMNLARHAICCQLPPACCLLPTVLCQVPAACCLLPTAYCLLPVACCVHYMFPIVMLSLVPSAGPRPVSHATGRVVVTPPQVP